MSSISLSPAMQVPSAAAETTQYQARRTQSSQQFQYNEYAKSEKSAKTAKPEDNGDDRLSRRKPSENDAQRQLNQRVMISLNSALAKDDGAVPAAEEYNDYTPDKVAGRILSFVETGVAQAEGDKAKLEKLEQAREGIQQGMDEAREILDGFGVLQGQIKDNVDRTDNLVKDGLNRTEEQLKSGEAPAMAKLKQVSRTKEQTASVEVQTKDGDIVTIDISRSRSKTRTVMKTDDENSRMRAVMVERSRSSSINFSVQGELDEGERKAINDLLKDLDKVSRKFFNGNIDQAFNKAAKLAFDQDELAAFSYSADQAMTRQKVKAYVSNSDAEPQKVESVPGTIKSYMGELSNLIDEEMPKVPMKQPIEAKVKAYVSNSDAEPQKVESVPGTIKSYMGELSNLIDEEMPKVPMKQPIEAIERLFTEIMQIRVAAEDDVDDDRKSGIELLRELVEKMVAKYKQPEQEPESEVLIAPEPDVENQG